ncbi:uncharacterized protein BDFB_012478 [Asbolus verrucosus]|uniref:Uncharacterized protein n=1 Tax=Asbolus verrucosus TaxID=1661398 RepID=A0A482V914_ASBVE|nr:uncharacterized protein BDFB_012478 [Asbolus verrucosus]
MMLLISGVLCTLVSTTYAGWLKDLISPSGFDAGGGLVLHLLDSQLPNISFLERHTIKMDYGGYGLSLTKAARKDAVDVGRGRKESSAMMHMIIGYTLATMATMAMAAVGGLVFKALGVAKIAAIISAILLLSKLFRHHHQEAHHHIPAYVEIEHGPEPHGGLAEFLPSGVEYDSSGSSNYYSYANYVPPGMVTNPINYGAVEPSVGNSSLSENQQVANVARRRDVVRKKSKIPLLTIHQYSIKS